jgi:hypothetical protein
MEGFLVLADSATTDRTTGKVHLLGAGWSLTGPTVPPSAIAGFLRIPWGDAKEDLNFRLQLLDENRTKIELPRADGESRPVRFDGRLGPVGTQLDEDVTRKVPMNLSFSLNIPPLPLSPGETYEWILEIEGAEVASVRFGVRPGATQQS